jgi:hypothetical protein
VKYPKCRGENTIFTGRKSMGKEEVKDEGR